MDRPITRDQALNILRFHRAEMEAHGIVHAALFGSLARGDATATSDLDIIIDFAPAFLPRIFQYAGLRELVGGYFSGQADVVARPYLRAELRANVERDAVHAF